MKTIININIICFIFLISSQIYSQSIEKNYFEPMLKILPDSIFKGIRNLDENIFVSKKYGEKELHLDFSTHLPNVWCNEFSKQIKDYEQCVQYFDSCFCGYHTEPLINALRRGFHRYINNKSYDIIKELDPSKAECYYIREIKLHNQVADSIDGIYIPKNIEEAIKILLDSLPKTRLDEIKNFKEDEVIAIEHFNLGLFIRNQWGLWAPSRLTMYFLDEYEILNPDAISGCIVLFLYRKLNNKDLDIEKTIEKEEKAIPINSDSKNVKK
jgi:hypothetical protein